MRGRDWRVWSDRAGQCDAGAWRGPLQDIPNCGGGRQQLRTLCRSNRCGRRQCQCAWPQFVSRQCRGWFAWRSDSDDQYHGVSDRRRNGEHRGRPYYHLESPHSDGGLQWHGFEYHGHGLRWRYHHAKQRRGDNLHAHEIRRGLSEFLRLPVHRRKRQHLARGLQRRGDHDDDRHCGFCQRHQRENPLSVFMPVMRMAEDVKPNGGPSWKWLVGILLTIIGVGFAAWMTAVWSSIQDLNKDVGSINDTLTEMRGDLKNLDGAVAGSNADIAKLWDKFSVDHELLTKDDYKLTIDDNWINAHANADNAIRRLHDDRDK